LSTSKACLYHAWLTELLRRPVSEGGGKNKQGGAASPEVRREYLAENIFQILKINFSRRQKNMFEKIKNLLKEERGVELVQVAIIMGILAVFAVTALFFLRQPLTDLFGNVKTQLEQAKDAQGGIR
jgi:Flp pilus assembly pilin Flp